MYQQNIEKKIIVNISLKISRVGSGLHVESIPTSTDMYLLFLYRADTAIFLQARPPQWRPHQQCAASAALAFYSAKSRQGLGLGGLASCGGPAIGYKGKIFLHI